MPRYFIFAVVDAPDDEAAQQVAAERLGHDEDYGFPYTIERFKTIAGDGDRQTKMGGKLILSIENGRTVFA